MLSILKLIQNTSVAFDRFVSQFRSTLSAFPETSKQSAELW